MTKQDAKNVLATGGVLIALIMGWLVWMALLFNGFMQARPAMDNAQAARHVANGDGLVTSLVRPLSFAATPRVEAHPDLMQPPFFKLVSAMLFKVGGATDKMAALASGLGWMVCGLLIYGMTVELAGRRRIGLAAVFLWMVSPLAGRFAVSGENFTWCAALVTGLLWVLMRAREKSEALAGLSLRADEAMPRLPYRLAILSGVLAGLLMLCEPSLMWMVCIPAIVFWARWPVRAKLPVLVEQEDPTRKRRSSWREHGGYVLRLLPCFLMPAMIIGLPWYVSTAMMAWPQLGGTLRSFAVLLYSEAYPGESIWRYAARPDDNAWTFWIFHAREALGASFKVVPQLPDVWLRMTGIVPAFLLALGLFSRPAPAGKTLRDASGFMFVLALVLFSLLGIGSPYFTTFLPAVLVIGVSGLDGLFAVRPAGERRPARFDKRMGRVIFAIAMVVATFPAINTRMNRGAKLPVALPPGLVYLMSNSDPGAVILTDAPWLVAWYGQRVAVWLPQRDIDLAAMREQGMTFDWIYLANPRTNDRREIGDWWFDLIKQPERGWEHFRPVEERFPREVVMRAR